MRLVCCQLLCRKDLHTPMVALMHGRRAGKKMTDEFLVGEIATLFMAGFETTGVPSLHECSAGLLCFTRMPACEACSHWRLHNKCACMREGSTPGNVLALHELLTSLFALLSLAAAFVMLLNLAEQAMLPSHEPLCPMAFCLFQPQCLCWRCLGTLSPQGTPPPGWSTASARRPRWRPRLWRSCARWTCWPRARSRRRGPSSGRTSPSSPTSTT